MLVITSPGNIFVHRLLPLLAMFVILALGLPATATAAKRKQTSFASPEKAAQGLLAAVKADDIRKVVAILGPDARKLVSSGDTVADATDRKAFVKLYEEKNHVDRLSNRKAILVIGPKDFPFPFPLVKKGKRWHFDTSAGREEILNRRIGKNELNAIGVTRAYVIAQREYASRDRDADGTVAFAPRLRSTPGTKDGLYWDVKEGEEESPFGPLTAQAASEGYGKESAEPPNPYHGYFFRILKGQGDHAEGGAYDYLVNGRMILGFALVAYPAQYGSSGIMTFIVNQKGVVYQKDLGATTESVATTMQRYDPDGSWKVVE